MLLKEISKSIINMFHTLYCIILQYWSFPQLQKTFLDVRKELKDSKDDNEITKVDLKNTKDDLKNTKDDLKNTKDDLKNTKDDLKNTKDDLKNTKVDLTNTKVDLTNTKIDLTNTKYQLDNLLKNPVPIGFIYVQLPVEPEPKNLWPLNKWTEISKNYAGVFFRVVGNGSAAFGSTQLEASPRLIKVRNCNGCKNDGGTVDITPGAWSYYLFNSNEGPRVSDGISFYVSKEEVRPKNMAIRIWKRTA